MMTVTDSVDVVEVAGSSDVFLDVPAVVYRDDKLWVPPIRSDIARQFEANNPFFQYGRLQAFLALEGGRPVGRVVAAVNDRLVEREGRPVGLVGFFECVENLEVARQLLQAACNWLRDQGMEMARGPINLSTHNSCMFLVDGFDLPPQLMMPYNPAYYPVFFQHLGWVKAKDAFAYQLSEKPLDERQERGYKFCKRGYDFALGAGIRFRSIQTSGDAFIEDCRSLYALFTQAFSNNWSYTEQSEAEFIDQARALRHLVDKSIFWVAEDNGKMAGVLIALPDYNVAIRHLGGRLNLWGMVKFLWYRRQIDRVRVLAIASLPEYRSKMVPFALAHLALTGGMAKRKRYKSIEMSWVYEDNRPPRKIIEAGGATIYKTYRMFEKPL